MAPPIRKQFTNQEWNIGFDNVYFSSLYGGCVVDQGYNLLTYIRESNRIDNSGVEYSNVPLTFLSPLEYVSAVVN